MTSLVLNNRALVFISCFVIYFQFASWCREIEYQYTLRDPITVFAFNDTAFNTLPSVERQVLQELDAAGRIEYVRSFTGKNILYFFSYKTEFFSF